MKTFPHWLELRLHALKPDLFTVFFYGLLSAFLMLILALPVFPSQDGPVHVYYASVVEQLLRHGGVYDHAFSLKHVLPPYALHSYILIALMQVMSPVAADKTLACLCVLLLALGFRAFVRTFGSSGALWSIAVLPFCLHRYLFMGFYNFTLSLGIAFLALAAWNAPGVAISKLRGATFLLLVVLLTLTHPVSLAVLLLLIGLDVTYRVIRSCFANRQDTLFNSVLSALTMHRARLVLLGLAALSVVYVAGYFQFSPDAAQTSGADVRPSYKPDIVPAYRALVGTSTVAPVVTHLYRFGMALLWVAGLAFALPEAFRRFRRGTAGLPETGLALGIVLAIAYPFIPWQINGAGYFNIRLTIFCPLLALAAASRVQLPRPGKLAAAAATITLVLLAELTRQIYPVAREVGEYERVSTPPATRVAGLAKNYLKVEKLSFDPYFWLSARLARRTQAVLVNGPWLELPTIMLGRAGQKLASTRDEDPKDLLLHLNTRSVERREILAGPSLLVVSQCGGAPEVSDDWLGSEPALARLASSPGCVKLYYYHPDRL